jgi:tetratricopeptide (TPR) repeat protein
MATLTVTGSFSARHGTRSPRSSRFDVEANVIGEIAGDFVRGTDDVTLSSSLGDELALLEGTWLDDIIGRATLENVAAYLLIGLMPVGVATVTVSLGGTRVTVGCNDVSVDRFEADLAFRRGVSFLVRGRASEALEALAIAARLHASSPRVHVAHGRALRKLGRIEEALHAFDAALAEDPDFGEAHRNRGNALLELGRGEEALESLRQAVRLLPDYALAHNNRGYALRLFGRFELALADHDRAIELDPGYEEAFRDRAVVREQLGLHDLARMDLARAEALRDSRDEIDIERSKLDGTFRAHAFRETGR